MFASFIVYLRPLEVAPLGRTLGRSLHGLLLRLISQTDPHLANALHSDLSLATQVVHYGGHQFNGFVGDCQFRLLH